MRNSDNITVIASVNEFTISRPLFHVLEGKKPRLRKKEPSSRKTSQDLVVRLYIIHSLSVNTLPLLQRDRSVTCRLHLKKRAREDDILRCTH